MKYFCRLISIVILISCSLISYSQKISAGIYSGINFSDLHGQDQGGKWISKAGPVQGFYLGYSLNKSIGIQTGINFSSVYYRHKQEFYPIYYDIEPSSYSYITPSYYPGVENMDFRFLRIPLLVNFTIPSTLQFNMGGGVFFSFLQGHDLSIYYFGTQSKSAKHDFGYIFTSGLAYPFNENFKATFNTAYITGRKKFLENYRFRNGSSEFTLGVTYSGFLKNKISPVVKQIQNDSLLRKIIVTVTGGYLHSWNGANEINGKYHGNPGLAIGFSLKFPIGRASFFQTGFTFERKGFSIKDSSTSFYRLIKDNNEMYYVNTKVQTDYAIIPALLSIPLGKPDFIYLTTGPWFGLKLNSRNVGVAYDVRHSQTSYELVKTVIYDDIEKLMKNYDLGWIFGCGFSIPVVKEYRIDVGLQYSTGFRDVFTSAGQTNQQYDPGLIIKNRTISLLLGIRLP
jgi:hypothetical protein